MFRYYGEKLLVNHFRELRVNCLQNKNNYRLRLKRLISRLKINISSHPKQKKLLLIQAGYLSSVDLLKLN